MKKPKVFVPNYVPPEVLRYLREHCDVLYRGAQEPPSAQELYEGLRTARGLMCYARIKVNETLLDQAPNLKIVSNIAVGYDNFDLTAMGVRSVMGTNTPGVLTETTADLTFGLLMAAARRICEADAYVKDGQWNDWLPSLLVGKDVHSATIGIVGMGRIGLAVARRAHGFQMRVLYHNRSRNLEAERQVGSQYLSLNDLLRESDYVVVLTPLSPETTGLIGENELALMKPDAILVNAARGPVVDETALVRALQQGQIGGAALDVYAREPVDKDNPLLTMKNVVTLPHIGSATVQTRLAMAKTAALNLVQGLSGQKPPNLVNPAVFGW